MTVDMGELLNDQLGAITNIHQGNVTTVAKAQDYQYLNGLNVMQQALALREVQTDPNAQNLNSVLATLAAFGKSN